VYPNEQGVWEIPSKNQDSANFKVTAASLKHSVPTYGFVVQERNYAGAMIPDLALPRLMDPLNVSHLAEQGVTNPKSCLGRLKKGESIQLADGILTPEVALTLTYNRDPDIDTGLICDVNGRMSLDLRNKAVR